jgi:hypothetical protein
VACSETVPSMEVLKKNPQHTRLKFWDEEKHIRKPRPYSQLTYWEFSFNPRKLNQISLNLKKNITETPDISFYTIILNQSNYADTVNCVRHVYCLCRAYQILFATLFICNRLLSSSNLALLTMINSNLECPEH